MKSVWREGVCRYAPCRVVIYPTDPPCIRGIVQKFAARHIHKTGQASNPVCPLLGFSYLPGCISLPPPLLCVYFPTQARRSSNTVIIGLIWVVSTPNSANHPQLDPQDVELLALLAEALVGEGVAGSAVAPAERVVEPQPEPAPAPAPHRQESRLAEHAVVVRPAVREVLEPDALLLHGWARG